MNTLFFFSKLILQKWFSMLSVSSAKRLFIWAFSCLKINTQRILLNVERKKRNAFKNMPYINWYQSCSKDLPQFGLPWLKLKPILIVEWSKIACIFFHVLRSVRFKGKCLHGPQTFNFRERRQSLCVCVRVVVGGICKNFL